MHERALVLSVPVILLVFTGRSDPQVRPLKFAERVDRYILSFPDYQRFQGVILVALGGEILFNKGYGLASREFSLPNGPDTPFQVGSSPKLSVGYWRSGWPKKG